MKETWQLFDAVAYSTDHRHLHRTVRLANDRLAPIRRAKQQLFAHTFEEISEMTRYWQSGDFTTLKSAIGDFHELEKSALLTEGKERLH